MPESESVKQGLKFLGGEDLQFDDATALWKQLKTEDQLSLARRIIPKGAVKPSA